MKEDMGIKYHGLDDLNDEGLPFYTQWGYNKPVLSISNPNKSVIEVLTDNQIVTFERINRNNKIDWVEILEKIQKFNKKAKIRYSR